VDSQFVPVQGIFDDGEVFTKYRVGLTFTELVVGGIPQNPEMIESWLRTRILGGDQELAIMLRRTLDDLEIEVPAEAGVDEMIAAAKEIAATRNANTFRRNAQGLCLAAYNVKAMLKEATAILYPYQVEKWGPTKKAARALLAERIFVDDYLIPLGRMEPDGTFMNVGHVDTPRGKRSTLSYHDYCVQPEIGFTMSSSEDILTKDQWARILIQGQKLGIGAMRSMGHGQFKVTALDKV
jgi:hypothetical protein